ncbi:hypothetical protein [Leuconostoc citreum]|uniref:hypothetical protein n=1 Tax=Leuconostoc citreum TaxID=33964 RepID=UPI0032E0551B
MQSAIEKVIEKVVHLFTRKANTIYEIRLVYDQYSDEVNIFFESHKIGYPTRSDQIGRLSGDYRKQLNDLKQQLHQATHLTVRLVN